MTEETRHSLERFGLHFIASGTVILLLYYLLSLPHWSWIPERSEQRVGFAALFVFAFSTVREAYDVAHGQSLAKAISDYASWASGCVVWGFILSKIVS